MAVKVAQKLYTTIKNDLKSQIQSGHYQPGDLLPSESSLCETYGVSRISARRALNDLECEGFIKRVPGKGSYVSEVSINHFVAGLYSLTSEISKRGMIPAVKVLQYEKMSPADLPGIAGNEFRRLVETHEGEEVYLLKRLRLANDEIIALDYLIIRSDFYPPLTPDFPINKWLSPAFSKLGIPEPSKAREYVCARPVDNEEDAELLNVSVGSCSLCISRVAYRDEAITDFTYRIFKGERFRYCLDLNYNGK